MHSFRLAAALAALALAAPCAAHPVAQLGIRRHDYGDRLPGVLPPAVFLITNVGDAPLILRPQPCCGLSLDGAQTPIPAGATRQLVAHASHPVGDGLFRKTIQVLTNDPQAPELQLELVAMGKSPIQLFPGDELTVPLGAAEPVTQTVVLRCNDEPVLKITSIRCSAPYLHCKEIAPELAMAGLNRQRVGIPDGEAPSRHRAVAITLAADAPRTAFDAVVVLGTNCKRRQEVKLHVYGLSPMAVMAQPPRIDFDPISKNETEAVSVVTLTRTMGPFKVLGVTASDPRMNAAVQMDPSGMFAQLTAAFRPGPVRGPFRGTIIVRTDDPQRPRVVITYAGDAG